MKLFSNSDKFEKSYFSIFLAFLPISFIAGKATYLFLIIGILVRLSQKDNLIEKKI